MRSSGMTSTRVVKTGWFAKAARKAHINDDGLCAAIREVMLGQANDLGGGVYKKRLGKNMYRSIILAKARNFWTYEYLFAKKDRDNIDDDELHGFRKLARHYARLTQEELARLLRNGDLVEICR